MGHNVLAILEVSKWPLQKGTLVQIYENREIIWLRSTLAVLKPGHYVHVFIGAGLQSSVRMLSSIRWVSSHTASRDPFSPHSSWLHQVDWQQVETGSLLRSSLSLAPATEHHAFITYLGSRAQVLPVDSVCGSGRWTVISPSSGYVLTCFT